MLAQPLARCPARELVELESWPKDTDGVAEDTKVGLGWGGLCWSWRGNGCGMLWGCRGGL